MSNVNKAMLHVDANGNPYFGGEYTHINNNQSTLLDNVPVYLHRVNVNTAGAGWTITIYDGTSASGAVVMVLDGSAKGSYELCAHLSTGMYVVTAGTTPGDVTLIWSSNNNA